ncbi:MAG: phosphinothricin acetyltransferase [Bacteroidota bacterium]|jgi:phosphinothricin acetyltransferase
MLITFEDIQEQDFEFVKEIYDYYILNSTATFHTEAIAVAELKEAIYVGHPRYKSFLISVDRVVVGFCYLAPYKKRQAYYRSAELTLYLKPDQHQRGIGTSVVHFMEKVAREQDIKVLLGVITASNTASISLFNKSGFTQAAYLEGVGEKFGEVLDVVMMQKKIEN